MKLDNTIHGMQEEILQSLQELIRIPSVEDTTHAEYPFGIEVQRALEYTLNLAESLGFRVKNVDNMVGYAECGSGEEMVGVLTHLDVVPAGDDWTFGPFDGVCHDHRVYGRGAGDDKGPTIAALYAVKALLDTGAPLTKRIRIIFGLNEETHWKSIAYYVEHEEIPTQSIVPDAAFPVIYGEKGLLDFRLVHPVAEAIDDGGIELLRLNGGTRSNVVPDHAEAILRTDRQFEHIVTTYSQEFDIPITVEPLDGNRYRVTVKGISAHAARPHLGKNALAHLINVLDKLDLQIGDSANFIRVLARHIGIEYHGEHAGCALEDEPSGKLTFNVGIGHLDEDGAQVTCNIRYPITETRETVVTGIKDTLSYSQFRYEETGHKEPLHIDPASPFVQTLLQVYRDLTGRDDPPLTMGGATYARSMPNAVSFGALMPDRPSLAHQKDEYILIDDLILTTRIYAKALLELTK